jgi:iron complex outermembrane recepter protein
MNTFSPSHLLATAVSLACTHLSAQSLAPTALLPSAASPVAALEEVIVTGNPLKATDVILPAVSLSRTELMLRAQPTLGETLSGLPGVASTGFGPNVGRPVIRGQDGDRIRILSNSGATLDASALSFDHAVPLETLLVDRIEVLRGPAALLYGGSAVGGVVNVVDGRIPRERLFDTTGGVAGQADARVANGNGERSIAARIEAGTDQHALHVDVFDRTTSDVAVPLNLACTRTGALTMARKICNSASHSHGGALGGSLLWTHGYLGASVAAIESGYGTVAEDEVTIGMRSVRTSMQGEVRQLTGFITELSGHISHTDYRHTEYDQGVSGTLFTNQGNAARLEARHRDVGAWQGVLGLQTENAQFAAAGDEAFAPFSHTSNYAIFVHEERGTSWGKFSVGARQEQVTVQSLGNPAVARFVPGQRQFNPTSLAFGVSLRGSGGWRFGANVTRSQRAPKDYELYADGPHLATNAWERGNRLLTTERSYGLDLGADWTLGPNRLAFNTYFNRFDNYIGLVSSGGTVQSLPELIFVQHPARFTGFEVQGNSRLLDGGQTLDVEWRGDLVRAVNATAGEPLPRIAPTRLGASLVWTRGPFSARAGLESSARQHRVPVGDLATPGYTVVSAAITYRMRLDRGSAQGYARLNNATDRLAYNAGSILTQTAPGKSPLAGRSLKLGVQMQF